MQEKVTEVVEMKEVMIEKADKVDQQLKQVAKASGCEHQLRYHDISTPV